MARAERKLGVEVLRYHPVGLARSAVHGLFRTLVGFGRSSMIEVTEDLLAASALEKALTGAGLVSALLLLAGGAAGAVVLARRREVLVLGLTALPIAYQLIVGTGPEADSRFHVRIVPLLAILAATAVAGRRCQRDDAKNERQVGPGP